MSPLDSDVQGPSSSSTIRRFLDCLSEVALEINTKENDRITHQDSPEAGVVPCEQ